MLFGLFDSDSSGIIRPEVFAKLVASGQVSISPTLYEHFFRTVVKWAAFHYLHLRFKHFWNEEIADKMLVKLTTEEERLDWNVGRKSEWSIPF